jgi:uncharacterized protein (TIGR03437 family)
VFSAHIALAFLMMSGAAVAQTYVISTSGALPGGLALSAAGASGGSPIVYTLAGTGVAGYSGDGGPATAAQVNFPIGMCLDSAGNLYFADYRNHRVRKVTPAGVITTVAGTGVAGFSGDGGPATSAQLDYPYGVTVDSAGNVYIADSDNNRVRRVSPAGIVTTVAGTGPGGYSGDGGQATDSLLSLPTGVASDDAGNLFIAEMYGRVRKISSSGAIATVAGTGTAGYAGDGGPATSAQLRDVSGLSLDGAGNLFIVDRGNHRIRKVSPAGIITTAAGNGSAGFSGDGGPAASAQLNGPSGVTADGAGSIYIADTVNHRVRKVSPDGVITTAAGNGNQGYSGDGGPPTSAGVGDTSGLAVNSAGDLYISDVYNSRIRVVRTGAVALSIITTSPLPQGTVGVAYLQTLSATGGSSPYTWSVTSGALPGGLTLASGGSISGTPSVTGSFNFTVQVRDSTAATATATLALTTAAAVPLTITTASPLPAASVGVAYSQTFNANGGSAPYTWSMTSPVTIPGLTLSTGGTISGMPATGGTYSFTVQVRDSASTTATKAFTLIVVAGGSPIITTVAGTGVPGFSGDGGPATSAQLFYPYGVTVDGSGNLYIAGYYDHRIRKVSPNGIITTVAGNGNSGFSGDGGPATSAQLYYPRSVVADGAGNLYIADSANHRIRKVSPSGIITTAAGTGNWGYSGDGGPATNAKLDYPYSVTIDLSGDLYIADTGNDCIRKVPPSGIITTVAGVNGYFGYSGDGGQATSAQLNSPAGIALDGSGNLYIADRDNNRIRKVSPSGIITTVAGAGVYGFSGDAGPATSAQLSYPYGVTVDGSGNLYITDRDNNRIRKVSPSGIITTVAGAGSAGYSGDGGPATDAQLYWPSAAAVDGSGNIYIADYGNHRIRLVRAGAAAALFIVTTSPLPQGTAGVAYSQTLSATGGTSPYTWSVTSDSLPGGLALSGGTISGMPAAAGAYSFTVQVRDAAAAIASRTFSLTVSSPSANPPVIYAGGIVNAASNAAGQPIAAGSLVSIYGANLATGTTQAGSIPLPTSLDNVSVAFNNVPAPLVFVAPGQINAQVPWNVLPGGAQSGNVLVVVTRGGVASSPATVSVGPFSPGIFALNYGAGNAIAINPDGSLAAPSGSIPGSAAHSAKTGDPNGLVILATGLGAMDSYPANGNNSLDTLRSNLTTPEVLVGGMKASVLFSGASPQFVGVNQINIAIPDGAPTGDNVPLQLRVGGITTTDRVTIAVTWPAGGCANIAGQWVTSEKGTLTCTLTANGESDTETDPINNGDIVTISQQGCQASYTSASITAAFGSGQSLRQGKVEGANVTFSGIMGELAPGFSYQKNLVELAGTLQNNVISLAGTGTLVASGVWQGMNTTFSCTATTTATMTKWQ